LTFASQGFASGDSEVDAFAVRQFVADGHSPLLAQSFSKNFGLYGERVGALSCVAGSPTEASAAGSQMKILARAMHSNPPIYGARLVATVLGDQELRKQWEVDCKGMADRITSMRGSLAAALAAAGSTKNWHHVTDQIGMFCYSGLSPDEVARMRADHSVYLTTDGRISMAGVNSGNVDYVAAAMHAVTK
jgi:aspartate aminotransferase